MVAETKFWVFTLNNPTVTDKLHLTFSKGVKYAIWQLEQGEQGTMHLQGYIGNA